MWGDNLMKIPNPTVITNSIYPVKYVNKAKMNKLAPDREEDSVVATIIHYGKDKGIYLRDDSNSQEAWENYIHEVAHKFLNDLEFNAKHIHVNIMEKNLYSFLVDNKIIKSFQK